VPTEVGDVEIAVPGDLALWVYGEGDHRSEQSAVVRHPCRVRHGYGPANSVGMVNFWSTSRGKGAQTIAKRRALELAWLS
jgi:hypothetical protein